MMSTPTYPAAAAAAAATATPLAVFNPQFCVDHPVDLTITRKMMTLEAGTFGVTDVNGNIMFQIRGKSLSLHDRRVLLDAAGIPIVTFQQKLMTAHRRWQVFRGESTDPKDMIFSVRKSKIMMMKTKLDVFIAGNVEEQRCDFRIEGSLWETSCVIYAGDADANNIIAQAAPTLPLVPTTLQGTWQCLCSRGMMHRKHSAKSILLGKDTFCVTVNPNVDQAFIVALVVILEEINEDRHAS